MRILVLTPLFPPDVSTSAVYIKKLVTKLSVNYDVTCLHYGQLPEKAGATTLVSVRKDVTTIKRLASFAYAIWRQRHCDIVLVMNGPSIELPFLLVHLLKRTKLVYVESDPNAITKASFIGKTLHRLMSKKSSVVLKPASTILNRPLLHPLDNTNLTDVTNYEQNFALHVEEVITSCLN